MSCCRARLLFACPERHSRQESEPWTPPSSVPRLPRFPSSGLQGNRSESALRPPYRELERASAERECPNLFCAKRSVSTDSISAAPSCTCDVVGAFVLAFGCSFASFVVSSFLTDSPAASVFASSFASSSVASSFLSLLRGDLLAALGFFFFFFLFSNTFISCSIFQPPMQLIF